MKVKYHLTIGFPGADHTEVHEVPDDWTEEQIDADMKEWAFNYIEYSFHKIDE